MCACGEMIAYCGLDCLRCPALLATRSGDAGALEETARRWSESAGRRIEAGSIRCQGCRSGSKEVNEFCAVCPVAECARGRGLKNCAFCGDYPCGMLEDFPAYTEEARANLAAIGDRLAGGKEDGLNRSG